jgi:formate dehydrogenase subunit gamma
LRFTATERAFHWGFAVWYLSLLASGLPLWLPGLRGWIYGWNRQVGVRLHLVSAVLWVVVPVAVILAGDRRALAGAARDLSFLVREDWAWLRRFPYWLFGRRGEPAEVDRFNAGQKVYAWFTVWTSAVLLLTGLALWPLGDAGATLVSQVAGLEGVRAWRYAHTILALVVVIPVLAHVFFALVHPRTRPSLAGMLGGRVPADWAAAEHPGWLTKVEQPQPNRPGPMPPPHNVS